MYLSLYSVQGGGQKEKLTCRLISNFLLRGGREIYLFFRNLVNLKREKNKKKERVVFDVFYATGLRHLES